MKQFPYVRVAAIVAGSFALVRLLMLATTIQYPVQLVEWLHQVEGWVSSVSLDLIKIFVVDPVLNMLRSYGFIVPQLDDMWRHVFVLNSLLLGSAARHHLKAGWLVVMSSMLGLLGAVIAGLWPDKGIAIGFLASWGLFYSINFSLLEGWRKDLASMVFAASVLAAYSVFAANLHVWSLSIIFSVFFALGIAVLKWRFALVMFTYAAAFAFYGLLTHYGDAQSGLLLVSVFVMATAVSFVSLGARDNFWLRKNGWSGLVTDTEFNIGIDILAVMAIALCVTLASVSAAA